MRRHAGRFFLSLLGIVSSCAAVSAQGDYQVLRSFVEPAYPPAGRLLEVPSGRLFGVAERGGAHGLGALLAYDRQPDGTVIATEVHAFGGSDGAGPMAGVIRGSDGALYGTTAGGGAENRGTVYRLGPDGAFSVLHSFTPNTGQAPGAELVEAGDGHLYGTTTGTGEPGTGTLFRITKAGAITVLHVFDLDGWDPVDALLDGGDGKLYGITRTGGRAESTVLNGAFYSITLDGTFTVLTTFERPGPVNPATILDGGDGFL